METCFDRARSRPRRRDAKASSRITTLPPHAYASAPKLDSSSSAEGRRPRRNVRGAHRTDAWPSRAPSSRPDTRLPVAEAAGAANNVERGLRGRRRRTLSEPPGARGPTRRGRVFSGFFGKSGNGSLALVESHAPPAFSRPARGVPAYVRRRLISTTGSFTSLSDIQQLRASPSITSDVSRLALAPRGRCEINQ